MPIPFVNYEFEIWNDSTSSNVTYQLDVMLTVLMFLRIRFFPRFYGECLSGVGTDSARAYGNISRLVMGESFIFKYLTQDNTYNEAWLINDFPKGQKWGTGKLGFSTKAMNGLLERLIRENPKTKGKFEIKRFGSHQMLNHDNFRRLVREALAMKMPVNVAFACSRLYNCKVGHHSVIAAYNAKADKVLLLDTAFFQIWIPTKAMFHACDSKN